MVVSILFVGIVVRIGVSSVVLFSVSKCRGGVFLVEVVVIN